MYVEIKYLDLFVRGYETLIGFGGVLREQAQKISIARTVVRNVPILFISMYFPPFPQFSMHNKDKSGATYNPSEKFFESLYASWIDDSTTGLVFVVTTRDGTANGFYKVTFVIVEIRPVNLNAVSLAECMDGLGCFSINSGGQFTHIDCADCWINIVFNLAFNCRVRSK